MNWPDLALKLTVLRQRVGLTQDQLARASGVHFQTISSFETGRRTSTIKLAQIEAIAAACGMTLADFFAWGDDGVEIDPDDKPEDAALDRMASAMIRKTPAAEVHYPSAQSSLGKRAWVRLIGWGM